MRKIALLLFWMLWSLPLMPGAQHHAHHPSLHILRAGQAWAHQAFEGCNQQFQEQHPCPATAKSAGRCPGSHRPRKATGVRQNRRSQQHAVADISGCESERQD